MKHPWHRYVLSSLIFASLSTKGVFCFTSFPKTNEHHRFGGKFCTENTIVRGYSLSMVFGIGENISSSVSIPSSTNARDSQAINAIKAAIKNPKDSSLPLIECEFPALAALNKLGDGSLRSTQEAEKSNLLFATKVLKSISPISLFGPTTWLLVSSSASKAFLKNAAAAAETSGARIHSLREGLPEVGFGDICILVTPSNKSDYQDAKKIASGGEVAALIVQNGFAKDTKSIPENATMAYFFKPLTYNSQVAGFLVRKYPGKWTTFNAFSKEVLKKQDDFEILVRGTNTPDLREPGRLVQKSVDARAIQTRKL